MKKTKIKLHSSSADEASKLKSMCFYEDFFKGQERKSITCSTCQSVNTNSIETSVITVTVPTNMTTQTPAHWIAEVRSALSSFPSHISGIDCFLFKC